MKQKISIRAFIKKNNKVLVLRRSAGRPSIIGQYELPGGHLSFGEQPDEALAHYLLAQLDVKSEAVRLAGVEGFIDPDDSQIQYVFILYEVGISQQATLRAKDPYNKYTWISLHDSQQKMITKSTEMLFNLIVPNHNQGVGVENNDVVITSDKNIIYSDGGSRGNPGPSAAAFVIMNGRQEIIDSGGNYLGITTNNQAEYQAVYQALLRAVELGLKQIDFRVDSMLVMNQLRGIYKIKNRDLWPIHEQIKELMTQFDKITFSHVRREFNRDADSLVNKILDERAMKTSDIMMGRQSIE